MVLVGVEFFLKDGNPRRRFPANAVTEPRENDDSRLRRATFAQYSQAMFAPALATSLSGRFRRQTPAIAEETAEMPLRIVVDLSDRQALVYRGDRLQQQYPLAIGKPGWETPTGAFIVTEKIEDPTWEHPLTGETIPPGTNNPLGDRWIGFWSDGNTAIGFHGTPDESGLQQAISHGCLRMKNVHVRQLFALVDVGTPVIVRQ